MNIGPKRKDKAGKLSAPHIPLRGTRWAPLFADPSDSSETHTIDNIQVTRDNMVPESPARADVLGVPCTDENAHPEATDPAYEFSVNYYNPNDPKADVPIISYLSPYWRGLNARRRGTVEVTYDPGVTNLESADIMHRTLGVALEIARHFENAVREYEMELIQQREAASASAAAAAAAASSSSSSKPVRTRKPMTAEQKAEKVRAVARREAQENLAQLKYDLTVAEKQLNTVRRRVLDAQATAAKRQGERERVGAYPNQEQDAELASLYMLANQEKERAERELKEFEENLLSIQTAIVEQQRRVDDLYGTSAPALAPEPVVVAAPAAAASSSSSSSGDEQKRSQTEAQKLLEHRLNNANEKLVRLQKELATLPQPYEKSTGDWTIDQPAARYRSDAIHEKEREIASAKQRIQELRAADPDKEYAALKRARKELEEAEKDLARQSKRNAREFEREHAAWYKRRHEPKRRRGSDESDEDEDEEEDENEDAGDESEPDEEKFESEDHELQEANETVETLRTRVADLEK